MPFNRDLLMQEMAGPCPMYLMKIVDCTNVDAPAEIPAEAEPLLARPLTKARRQMPLPEATTHAQAEGQATTAASPDHHSSVTTPGGHSPTAPPPPTHNTRSANSNALISFTSSTNIQYKVRYEEYAGRAIMKAKDKEVYAYGFGEVPPTALQHPENDEEASRGCFRNSLTLGGLKWHKVESRLDAANTPTNKLLGEWRRPAGQNSSPCPRTLRFHLRACDGGTAQNHATT